MANRNEFIRRRILLAFGIVSFLGMATTILCIYWMQSRHTDEEVKQRLASTQRLLDILVREEGKALHAHLVLLAKDQRLQGYWLAGDRERLLAACQPLFADLQAHCGINHFYFIKPDGTCFLRVHEPRLYGDVINRYTLQKARRSGAVAQGLELDPLGTFTLRVVLPWRIGGEIAGYLELGEGLENITPKIGKIIGIELLFAIHKENLARASWEEGRAMLGQAAEWDRFPDSVVDNRTLPAIPSELEKLIRLPRAEHANLAFAIEGNNGVDYYGGFLPLIDAGGRNLGDIIVLQDVTEEVKSLHLVTGFLISIFVLLGGCLFGFFYFFTGRVERRLLAARDRLESEIEERGQAQRELTAYKDHLEEKVAARMRDLQAANASLQEEMASREEAERQARKAMENWERTYDAIGDIVTLHDEKMRMVRVNRAAAEAFGVEPRDLIGRYCYEVFRGEGKPCAGCPEALALFQSQMHSAEIVHPNLSKTFLVTASPLADEAGRFAGVVHIAKDITVQKQLEGQLRQAQRIEAVGTLAGGVAHDFNNLLTGILGYAELCLGETDPGSQLHADLTETMRLARRGADLIRQLQAFSRQQVSQPVPLDLNELVANLLKMLGRLIGENIDLRFSPTPGPGLVEVDPGQMEQVLINLAVNARDAMPEGGCLVIETAAVELGPEEARRYADLKPGPYVRLTVRDSGHGMEPDVLRRIFDPFFTTKEAPSCSGLGLAVIFGIIKQHQGSIRAESSPGQGTTFIIHLPRAAGEQQAAPEPSPCLAGRLPVLLVEDEPAVREVVLRMLERIGCKVLLAENPDAAEEVLKTEGKGISLLLTDVVMPGRNGRELYDRLAGQEPGLRVLFMSGYADSPVVETEIVQAGLPFIAKPFSPDKLAAKLREIFEEEKGDGRARLQHGGLN
ncbi:MAG: response regulator [Desulfobacteraceae bacterium]|nr:response regulator [Desulfobacteraceae bacterium]